MDFEFLQNKLTGKWVISAPRRAQRPDEAKGEPICPFCPGKETQEQDIYKEGEVRVLKNKFPFAPIHEVIVHSLDHHKNFGSLDEETTELIFKTYRQRFQTHKDRGQVYIFHNRGERAGESLPHPHSQVAVVPQNIKLEIPPLDKSDFENAANRIETSSFYLFSPRTSDWPDEVWVTPKSSKFKVQSSKFGDANDEQIADLANIITKLVQIFSIKYGKDFPYNFYISPNDNWYLRFIPRTKTLGGFEIGTNVSVNTQSSKETLAFIREHFS